MGLFNYCAELDLSVPGVLAQLVNDGIIPDQEMADYLEVRGSDSNYDDIKSPYYGVTVVQQLAEMLSNQAARVDKGLSAEGRAAFCKEAEAHYLSAEGGAPNQAYALKTRAFGI